MYDPEKKEACVNLVIVDSIGVELTESLVADITLTEPSPVIEISEAMSFTIIQILDDDSTSKFDMMCFLSQSQYLTKAAVFITGDTFNCFRCNCGTGEDSIHSQPWGRQHTSVCLHNSTNNRPDQMSHHFPLRLFLQFHHHNHHRFAME